MKIFDDTSPAGQEEILRRLLLRWLPMLAACLLLLLIQGGIPPATWRQLQHAYLLLGTLTAQQQKAVFPALYILVIQMLLLVGAWGVYLWLVVREATGVWHILTAHNQAAGATASSKGRTRPGTVQPTLIAATVAPRVAQQAGQATRYEQLQFLPPPGAVLVNPFEIEEPTRPVVSPLTSPISAINSYRRVRIERVESEEQSAVIQPTIIHEEQAAALHETTDMHRSVLGQIEFFPPEKLHAAEPASTRQAQSEPDKTAPRELSGSEKTAPYGTPDKTTPQGLLELGQPYPYEFRAPPPPPPEIARWDNSTLDAAGPDRQPAEFVYGNPFDTPLPDVFQEDEDLKRLAGEQQTSAVIPAMSAAEQTEDAPEKKASPSPSESGPIVISAHQQHRLSADSGGRRRRVPPEDLRKTEQQS